jgi:hypothetical protein
MELTRAVFCNLEEGENASISFKNWPKTGALIKKETHGFP